MEIVENKCKKCGNKNFPPTQFDKDRNICLKCKNSKPLCKIQDCIIIFFALMIIWGIGMNIYDKYHKKALKEAKKSGQRGWNIYAYKGEHDFSENSQHTVLDEYTNLIWQNSDDGTRRTYNEAVRYCNNLDIDGYSRWRIPDFKEIYYLADKSKYPIAIDTKYFKMHTKHKNLLFYWSKDKNIKHNDKVFVISLKNGAMNLEKSTNKNYTLCVHDKQE